jgi:hypothetical protein
MQWQMTGLFNLGQLTHDINELWKGHQRNPEGSPGWPQTRITGDVAKLQSLLLNLEILF